MPRIFCPWAQTSPCDDVLMQQNTFLKHVIEKHLSMPQVDYILQQLFAEFNPAKLKCSCTTKCNWKSRRDLCAHLAHKHWVNRPENDFIQNAFIRQDKEKFSPKEELEVVDKEIKEQRMLDKEVLQSLKKPLLPRNNKREVSFAEEDDYYSDSSATSARSNTTQVDKDAPFNPVQSAVLRNTTVLELLTKLHLRFLKKVGDDVFSPEQYFFMFPDKDDYEDYTAYLDKQEKKSIDAALKLAKLNLEEQGDSSEDEKKALKKIRAKMTREANKLKKAEAEAKAKSDEEDDEFSAIHPEPTAVEI
jgi:hypothetical protein